MVANLSCPHCGESLPINLFGPGQPGQCPACRSQVEAYIFPEFYREKSVAPAIPLAQEQEAVCYFHARYRATTPCDHCGRFLCQACAIMVGHRQLCAECLSQLRKLRDETGLVQYAALFDNVALFLVTAPVLTVFFSFFTIFSAPVSLFLSFYYWPRQWNLLPRSRLRFVIAILLSLLLIAAWALAIYYLATSRK
ncbi:MAG: hypothetical protein QOH78_2698 [Verrucomicrobiota bacterium]|jgi:hypothetical protein